MCCDCCFVLSEEFSKVQEESTEKASEMLNQPEKNGNAEI